MHIVKVTNISRWLFLDLHTLRWDTTLIEAVLRSLTSPIEFQIVYIALSTIQPSSRVYGTCHPDYGVPVLGGVTIGGILEDQQAALVGKGAFQPDEAKNTYGPGLFFMMNTVNSPVESTHGLLTTTAY